MGYLHNVSPKMTGGPNQDKMDVSPEAKAELADKVGKHKIDSDLKEAPSPLSGQELGKLKNNENPEKQSNKVAAGSHVGPNMRGAAKSKTIGKQTTILKQPGKPLKGGMKY